ncbi:MAG: hypothetical protein EOP22_14915 [Hyphomicrobiales bacterium]|nr:MAG: hypothetical protein EOP22_14915 [Hyphomicrobiales bacterium]
MRQHLCDIRRYGKHSETIHLPPLKSISVVPTKLGGNRKKPSPTIHADEGTSLALQIALARASRPVVATLTHRYRIGDSLRMTGGGPAIKRTANSCRIVFLLPYEGHGALLYRVRGERESFERIVTEADLTR